MSPHSFSYRLRRWPFVLMIPPAAAMAFHFYNRLEDASGAIELLHFIELRGNAAGAFHLLGLAFFGLALLMMVLGLVASFAPARVIDLQEDVARLPKSALSARVVEVPYHRIYGLEVQHLGRQQILRILHVGGKISLTSMALHDRTAFEQIVSVLSRKSGVTPQVQRVA